MAIIVNTPKGPVLVDEVTGNVLDSAGLAARNLAEDVAAPLSTGAGGGDVIDPAPAGGGGRGEDGSFIDGDTETPAPTPPTAVGPRRVIRTVSLPGGNTQVEYEDGTFEVQTAKAAATGTAASGVSRQNNLDTNAQNDRDLAERRRASNETLMYNKAVNDQRAVADAVDRDLKAKQSAEQLDVQRGNTLLGLGQRPDTLIKYLYALRGQQTPQAIGGTTTNLPGYQNVIGQPNPQSISPSPVAAGGVGPSSAPSLSAPVGLNLPAENGFNAPRLGQAGAPNVQTSENLTLAARNPAMSTAIGLPNVPHLGPQQGVSFSPLATNAQGGTQYANSLGQQIRSGPGSGAILFDPVNGIANPTLVAQQAAFKQSDPSGWAESQRRQQGLNDETSMGERGYAHGGVIPEEVRGVGQESGQPYTFGEQGPETVVPSEETTAGAGAFAAEFFKALQSKSGEFATGGTIGYGANSSDFFNNPNLKGVVDRGYNSSPQTPLFPQIGIATNGGQSLIPSTQRLNSLLPSEQALYSGALTDEFGANAQDVFSMTKQLAPQVSGLRTPRFTN